MHFTKKFRWLLVILWMCFIFTMSHLDGVKSWYLTGDFLSTVMITNTDSALSHEEKLSAYEAPKIANQMIFIRKSAHFVEYFILVLLLVYAISYHSPNKNAILYSILIGLLYAFLDEFHQIFIPGRCASIFDVFIDSFGVLTGSFVLFLIARLRKVQTDED